MKRVWRGGVAEGPCGGRSQKKTTCCNLKKTSPWSRSHHQSSNKGMKIGHVFVYFCVMSGDKNQQKQKNVGVRSSKRLDLCNS